MHGQVGWSYLEITDVQQRVPFARHLDPSYAKPRDVR